MEGFREIDGGSDGHAMIMSRIRSLWSKASGLMVALDLQPSIRDLPLGVCWHYGLQKCIL
jgi:hypothetical protein